MIVWILNHFASLPDRPVGTRHFDLARRLKHDSYSVYIWAAGFDHWAKREVRLENDEQWRLQTVEGVHFVWLRTPKYSGNGVRRFFNHIVYAWRVWNLRKKIPPPDIVVGSSIHPFAAWIGHRVAHERKVPFIFEVRDIWPQTLIDLGVLHRNHPLATVLRWLENHLYRSADLIMTPLPHASPHIEASGVSTDKIAWIPNGVDLSRSPNPQQPTGQQAHFLVMYAGAHGPANGLDVLIQAAEILHHRGIDDVRFILIGDGPEKLKLIEMATQKNLPNIDFQAGVPKTEVMDRLARADALLFHLNDMPVLRFGVSSNKLFDYMAAARPVIFACAAGNNPIAEAGSGLTIPPESPEAMANAILELKNMPLRERVSMGIAGRAYVEENHSWDRLSLRFEELLEGLVSSRGRS